MNESEKMKKVLEVQSQILKEMEEIPKEWESKVHWIKSREMYAIQYFPGRDFTEGYDFVMIYFNSKMSLKIFLNKHHESCL